MSSSSMKKPKCFLLPAFLQAEQTLWKYTRSPSLGSASYIPIAIHAKDKDRFFLMPNAKDTPKYLIILRIEQQCPAAADEALELPRLRCMHFSGLPNWSVIDRQEDGR